MSPTFTIPFLTLCYPFTWKLCLKSSGDLTNGPLWMFPLFFGAWAVAWGTGVAALLQSTRLKTSENMQPMNVKGSSLAKLPAIWVNFYFVFTGLAAPAAMAVITVVGTLSWNRGIAAYNKLDKALAVAEANNNGQAGNADTVLAAVPLANEYLATMSSNFWKWSLPFGVCLTFAAIAAVTMLLACFTQVRTLSSQIRFIREAIARSTSQVGAPSLNSSIDTELDRKAGLFAYISVCVVGQDSTRESPIFHIHRDGEPHLYVVLFVYGVLDTLIVSLVLFQTFDTSSPRSMSLTTSNRRTSGAHLLSHDSSHFSSSISSMKKHFSYHHHHHDPSSPTSPPLPPLPDISRSNSTTKSDFVVGSPVAADHDSDADEAVELPAVSSWSPSYPTYHTASLSSHTNPHPHTPISPYAPSIASHVAPTTPTRTPSARPTAPVVSANAYAQVPVTSPGADARPSWEEATSPVASTSPRGSVVRPLPPTPGEGAGPARKKSVGRIPAPQV
ncbi:hypothetical protein MNV49_006233 [Pseudohyphozyma bogoriensis]|nr:hypothetical protein MNV49_006233 [Pseudohyphozyma bogoriensis]